MSDRNRKAAEGLRALADLIEATPELEPVYIGGHFPLEVWSAHNAETLAKIARVALAGGWKVDKDVSEMQYNLLISRDGFQVRALADRRAVCERVVTGTREVEKPDPAAPRVTVTEEVVEWVCKPLLAEAVDQ